jgi:hypothetical protein
VFNPESFASLFRLSLFQGRGEDEGEGIFWR